MWTLISLIIIIGIIFYVFQKKGKEINHNQTFNNDSSQNEGWSDYKTGYTYYSHKLNKNEIVSACMSIFLLLCVSIIVVIFGIGLSNAFIYEGTKENLSNSISGGLANLISDIALYTVLFVGFCYFLVVITFSIYFLYEYIPKIKKKISSFSFLILTSATLTLVIYIAYIYIFGEVIDGEVS